MMSLDEALRVVEAIAEAEGAGQPWPYPRPPLPCQVGVASTGGRFNCRPFP